MFKYLLELKPKALPEGKLHYDPDLPSVQPIIDSNRQLDEAHVDELLLNLQLTSEVCSEKFNELKKALETKLAKIHKLKKTIIFLIHIFNEQHRQAIRVDTTNNAIYARILPSVGVRVDFSNFEKSTFSVEMVRELYDERLLFEYTAMLQIEFDLGYLRYQQQVILINKRRINHWLKQRVDETHIDPMCAVLRNIPAQAVHKHEEVVFKPQDMEFTDKNGDRDKETLAQKEQKLYQQLELLTITNLAASKPNHNCPKSMLELTEAELQQQIAQSRRAMSEYVSQLNIPNN